MAQKGATVRNLNMLYQATKRKSNLELERKLSRVLYVYFGGKKEVGCKFNTDKWVIRFYDALYEIYRLIPIYLKKPELQQEGVNKLLFGQVFWKKHLQSIFNIMFNLTSLNVDVETVEEVGLRVIIRKGNVLMEIENLDLRPSMFNWLEERLVTLIERIFLWQDGYRDITVQQEVCRMYELELKMCIDVGMKKKAIKAYGL